MREILKYAATNRLKNGKNAIVKKSLETPVIEDKIIKIITKEITDLVVRTYKYKIYKPFGDKNKLERD